MIHICQFRGTLLRALLVLLLSGSCLQAAPRFVYLTWQGDTSRTMTVNFQTMAAAESPRVQYAASADALNNPQQRRTAQGTSHQIPGLPDGRWVHWIELRDLEPGQTYHFIAGDDAGGFSEPLKFRTIPADDAPLRFVVGGDSNAHGGDLQVSLFRQAAAQSPQFMLFGGDYAYENGDLEEVGLWDAWLDMWTKHMVTPDGHLIPIVGAIGNHEVRGGYKQPHASAPFYYGFLAQAGEHGYYTRTFGRLMALHVLDTDHTTPYEGAQTTWLERQLDSHQQYPFRMALYHVPLYPSRRNFGEGGSPTGRKLWGPLFDRFRLTAAFEHHDHTFKRSHLLRDNKVVEQDGTLYLGDGAFGRGGSVDYPPRWYLARSGGMVHFWRVDLSREGAEYRAIDHTGRVFDVFPETAAGAEEATAYFRSLDKRYRLRSPLVLGGAAPTSEPEFKAGQAEMLVHNHLDHAVQVTLQPAADQSHLRADEAPAKPVVVDAGQTSSVALKLTAAAAVASDAVKPLPVAYTVKHALTGDLLVEDETAVHVEPRRNVPTAATPMEIDGKLDEWGVLPMKSHRGDWALATGGYRRRYTGAEDASFAFAVRQDAKHVYVAVQVRDDSLYHRPLKQGEAPTPRGSDSVSIIIDARPEAARREHELGTGQRPPIELMISPTATAEDAPILHQPAPGAEGLKAVCVRTDAGYVLEMSLPHAVLDAQQQRGWEALRLNVMVSDYDPSETQPNPSWDDRTELHWLPAWRSRGSYVESGLFHRHADGRTP
jgi:acid phosphatase type 7